MIVLLPLVLTPLNNTVIRFTHDGIPVKSMLVPLVDATAVPLTMLLPHVGAALEPWLISDWPVLPVLVPVDPGIVHRCW